MRTADGVSEDFQVKTGVRQGRVLSPLLFNCVMDRILREAIGRELQHKLDVLDRACAWWGMQISVSKTKILTVEEQGPTGKGQAIHHTVGPSTAGSGVFFLPGQ